LHNSCLNAAADGTWLQDYKAYKCAPGVAAPSGPTPPAGYFGDPQLLVLESRDPDSELRNFSPVTFDTEGVKVGRGRAGMGPIFTRV
jgi:hypothetical protein